VCLLVAGSKEVTTMAIARRRVENGGLILFLVLITVGLTAVISGFITALLWAALAALLFQPIFQRLLRRWPGRRNTSAAVTILIITVAVVIPAIVLASLVIEQAAGVYGQIRSGQINFADYFLRVHDALPFRFQRLLDSSGFDTFERAQSQISDAISGSMSVLAAEPSPSGPMRPLSFWRSV
jgi:predicted PurR-regulated permease PerM